ISAMVGGRYRNGDDFLVLGHGMAREEQRAERGRSHPFSTEHFLLRGIVVKPADRSAPASIMCSGCRQCFIQ
ncbi:hypothetical protein, partial [Mesorhizobium sp. M2E.F.Ca.ET.209.01.1.1]|uniref:hypothetical protein n=1 Tax=Mesorhizobium sp. M2E.F.Ca.ET.209.01.1.1 TaxID=2500526 RepID=UPI001AEEAB3E